MAVISQYVSFPIKKFRHLLLLHQTLDCSRMIIKMIWISWILYTLVDASEAVSINCSDHCAFPTLASVLSLLKMTWTCISSFWTVSFQMNLASTYPVSSFYFLLVLNYFCSQFFPLTDYFSQFCPLSEHTYLLLHIRKTKARSIKIWNTTHLFLSLEDYMTLKFFITKLMHYIINTLFEILGKLFYIFQQMLL